MTIFFLVLSTNIICQMFQAARISLKRICDRKDMYERLWASISQFFTAWVKLIALWSGWSANAIACRWDKRPFNNDPVARDHFSAQYSAQNRCAQLNCYSLSDHESSPRQFSSLSRLYPCIGPRESSTFSRCCPVDPVKRIPELESTHRQSLPVSLQL